MAVFPQNTIFFETPCRWCRYLLLAVAGGRCLPVRLLVLVIVTPRPRADHAALLLLKSRYYRYSYCIDIL